MEQKELQIKELLELSEKSTPRPWYVELHWESDPFSICHDHKDVCLNATRNLNDAQYIVMACNLAPELAKRVQELEAKLKSVTLRHDTALALYSEYHDVNYELRNDVYRLEKQVRLLADELVSRGHIIGSVADKDLALNWIRASEEAANKAIAEQVKEAEKWFKI